jgi:peptide chain release factor 2
LNSCLIAWVKPRTIFDIPALNAKIGDLEQVAAQPDFWDSQAMAQDTLRELDDLKSHLNSFHRWKSTVEDARAVLELLELEDDSALREEAERDLKTLSYELDQWELQRLLSGLYDKNGAVLTINAGAGGTDAQDWAEMLLRMYTRWAERRGYKVHLAEFWFLCLWIPQGREGNPSTGEDFAVQCQWEAANQFCRR